MLYYKLRYILYWQYTIGILLFSNRLEKTNWLLSESDFDITPYSEISTETPTETPKEISTETPKTPKTISTETHKPISSVQAHRRSDLSMGEIEATSNSLKSLIKDLGAFSSATTFAFEEFDWSADKLSGRLSQLRDLILGRCLMGISQYESILESLTFAENMFDTMIESVEVIKHSRMEGEVASTCIRLMAILRVRLLTFYDQAGHPDGQRLNYAFELSQLEELYDVLVARFNHIQGLSFSTKTSFEKHLRAVNNSFIVLKSYVLKKQDDDSPSEWRDLR